MRAAAVGHQPFYGVWGNTYVTDHNFHKMGHPGYPAVKLRLNSHQ